MKQRDSERQLLLLQRWKIDNYVESNREMSIIAIAILGNFTNCQATQKCLTNLIFADCQ